MKNKLWLVFILITIVTWGVWGAFSDRQMEIDKIPETVVYILWAISMIPCAIVALIVNKGKIKADWKSILLGCTVGLLGAGGQLVLFKALSMGPAYIIFPFISMSPVIVITLASIFLKEKANKWQMAGIGMALAAILLLSIQTGGSREFTVTFDKTVDAEEAKTIVKDAFMANAPEDAAEFEVKVEALEEENQFKVVTDCAYLEENPTFEQFQMDEIKANVSGWLWIVLAILVLFAWGIQGFFMKFANNTMDAESIFVWMAISGLILAPIAWFMSGDAATFFAASDMLPKSATCFGIQILNSIGALTLVYAYRHGKAVIVSPMEGLSPMVTVLLSLIILAVIPTPLQIAGICCAAFAMYALSK